MAKEKGPYDDMLLPTGRALWTKALYVKEAFDETQKPKHSIKIMVPKVPSNEKQKVLLATFLAACNAVGVAGMKGLKGGLGAKGYDDGDSEFNKGKGYEGHYILTAKTDYKPGLVESFLDTNTGKPKVIADETTIYSGCFVRIRADVYFTTKGKTGGAAGGVFLQLKSVQKVRDGEPIAGTHTGEDDYDAVDPDETESDDDFMG